MIEDKQIEEILKTANIVDIISGYLPLTKKGKNYFGVCPFHEDHSPSMSVSEEKQIYKCFSCGASGNVFTFVKDYENISFIEAVKTVASKCGMILHENVKLSSKKETNQKEYEIMDLALKFYQNNLNTKEGIDAKKYLEERNLNETIIKDFEIGLSLNNTLSKFLLSKNYTIDSLLELGLVSKNDNDSKYDIFHQRIMFPIHDLEGRCVGFTGRIYHNEEQAKYMNSKESMIFKKGQILFNYHRAINEIRKKKEVVIVEGNMDAIRMYASGFKNVIALMGTSLTSIQIEVIKKLRAKVILMFDNDSAGEIATYQNGKLLAEKISNLYVVRLSGKKDPDEYILTYGVEAMQKNIQNPISFLDFRLEYIKKNKDLSKTNDLVNYIKELVEEIKDIEDPLTRELIIKKTSDEYQIPYDVINHELKGVSTPPKEIIREEVKKEKKKLTKYEKACQNLIYFMMNDLKYVTRFQKELGYISNQTYRNITNEIIYYTECNKKIELSSFIAYASNKEWIHDDVMEIIKNVNIEDCKMEVFEEFIDILKKEETKKEIDKLKKEIEQEFDNHKKIELANKLINLKKGCVGYEKE